MNEIADRLHAVRQRVAAACAAAGRAPDSVRLLAVSKGHDAAAIEQAGAAGQLEFGENYVSEALAKIAQLPREKHVWHFIGPLQSNKTREVAENFDWAHSVDRLKTAQRLSAQRPAGAAPLNVCVQVNVSGEASKSGCAPAEALELCRAIAALPRLELRGLMAIPAPGSGRAPYALLRSLRDEARRAGLALDTISAGMSDDLEDAIAEGSTLVRIGTAIFGARNRQ
ncbi:MAG TPA: YggS family pyridoxal phosphate-dependent enzyme [Nevskiaceae bacterium]|nr:YggS family pyridoxal phosphate-dependent enzyme [Nevskiaceae bacterium]